MPRPRRRWASACSTTPRSRRATRRRQHGAERVAIVDFDVHHGNGTQDIFWNDATRDVLLDPSDAALSRHRRGVASAASTNTIVNAPLRPGDGGEQFREAMETAILPRLEAFAPDLDHHLGRLRRAHARSARQPEFRRSRLRLGDAEADGGRRPAARTAASCRCSKAATTSKGCRSRSPRM